ncbi:hypothetical protein KEF85_13405 [Methylomonas paludis]|uniref:Uncharacterized protein n=1 Tax=Methylomonas paludis TaxID=1173101 RepID=A0A975R9L8_9GAMM|nr:hypothetical protein [Methylomonas paludis]QWF70326.1 hypothetical protein KEF85_13405 [Methylomonas paludis]
MQTNTLKQEAIAAIQTLPENADMEDIMYRLYVLENIRRGQQDNQENNTLGAEALLNEIQSW